MNADRTVLTDEMWARVAPLCPGQVTDPGCTAVDNRLCLEGVLWRFRTGTSWRDLPPHFGRWTRVVKRFRRGAKADLCERIVHE
ncbi:MAG: transposase [Rhodobacteraceae bacterium]|nr:transposase [Paracoccaceae bacterium]